MPPGVRRLRGPLPTHEILDALDGFFAKANNARLREVLGQLQGLMPLLEMAPLVTVKQKHLDHLRNDWFGANESQGGRYWKGLQPLARPVRQGLVEAIGASINPGGRPHLPIHCTWVEGDDTSDFRVTIFKGSHAVVMVITSPRAPHPTTRRSKK